jgi:type II secretory pathway pseudopilin PulG
MKKTALVIAVFGIVTGIVSFGFVQLRDAQRIAEATREASKMMELRTRLASELEIFYQKHGAYPQKLQDLPLEKFNWGMEGAMPKDLNAFSYVADGQTFVMHWKGEGRYEVYLAGDRGESKYSEDRAASKSGN